MNDFEPLLQQAEDILNPWSQGSSRPEGYRVDVRIQPEDLTSAVQALQVAHWGYLAAITGLDHPPAPPAEGENPAEGNLEAIYSYCNGAAVLNLRLLVPYHNPHVPTVCDLIPSATLYERELMEMFGVIIDGTPDTSRLILADAWPDGVYPLRKSFTHTASDIDKIKGAGDE
jgi:Ni,Fe-hydrogenase III component G